MATGGYASGGGYGGGMMPGGVQQQQYGVGAGPPYGSNGVAVAAGGNMNGPGYADGSGNIGGMGGGGAGVASGGGGYAARSAAAHNVASSGMYSTGVASPMAASGTPTTAANGFVGGMGNPTSSASVMPPVTPGGVMSPSMMPPQTTDAPMSAVPPQYPPQQQQIPRPTVDQYGNQGGQYPNQGAQFAAHGAQYSNQGAQYASQGSQYGNPGPQQQQHQPQMQQPQKPGQQAYGAQWLDANLVAAEQNRLLAESMQRVQQASYYLRQAMEADDLAAVLDRTATLLDELGDQSHKSASQAGAPSGAATAGRPPVQLNPKGYYEIHMRAMDELPNLEEFFLSIGTPPKPGVPASPLAGRYSMRTIYETVQYCPKVVPRLYLQICAGAALIRSGDIDPSPTCSTPGMVILKDLIESVKCVQCPIRGLFLRHYLLQATRDKLPDDTQSDPEPSNGEQAAGDADQPDKSEGASGDAKKSALEESYEFVLANFVEMNKLWVRIQHMPGEKGDKEARRRRERERNELRILVGTNLVRLSQLDGITSNLYGTVILPRILEQITACRDALAQAYLMDCIIQVFPDEFHIQTLEVFLNVCPQLKDKVNVRTILQSIMERLEKYYADEKLLQEEDSDGIKGAVSGDTFAMFDDCIKRVISSRGTALPAKEVVRLETSLLNFALRCYPGRMDHISQCLGTCAASLRGDDIKATAAAVAAAAAGADGDIAQESLQTRVADATTPRPLDEMGVKELETFLSIPLDSLALKVLELDQYSELLTFLPWNNRRAVAAVMLKAVEASGTKVTDISEVEQLFAIIAPLVKDDPVAVGGGFFDAMSSSMSSMGETGGNNLREQQGQVARLIHVLHHDDPGVTFQMLGIARKHLGEGGGQVSFTLLPVIFSALRLVSRVLAVEFPAKDTDTKVENDGTKVENDETKVDNDETKEENDETKEENDETKGENDETNEGESKKEEKTEPEATSNSGDEQKIAEGGGEVPTDERGSADASAKPPSSLTCRKVFVFVQTTIAMMASSNPALALQLYLQASVTADRVALAMKRSKGSFESDGPAVVSGLLDQALTMYEVQGAEPKAQGRAVSAIVGTLLSCRSLVKDDEERLATKAAQFAAKLVTKTDQCRMVTLCSHLFFRTKQDKEDGVQNPQRVLECLQRGLRIADACCMASPSNVSLFVDILDHYVYFFEIENPSITAKFVSGLISLIREHMDNAGTEMAAMYEAQAHFRQTVEHIKRKKGDAATAERFGAIVC